jgi:Integrase core domain
MVSKVLDQWAYRNGVKLDFNWPGKPTDNAYVESFNGRLRGECPNANWFLFLEDPRGKIEASRRHYHETRPHRALGEKMPHEFANEIAASRDFIGMQTARKLTLGLVQKSRSEQPNTPGCSSIISHRTARCERAAGRADKWGRLDEYSRYPHRLNAG